MPQQPGGQPALAGRGHWGYVDIIDNIDIIDITDITGRHRHIKTAIYRSDGDYGNILADVADWSRVQLP